MKLWAVFRLGIYRHECGGLFDSPALARTAALALLAEEPDDHHWYEVVPFVLNEKSAMEQGDIVYDWRLKELDAVFDAHRVKDGVVVKRDKIDPGAK